MAFESPVFGIEHRRAVEANKIKWKVWGWYSVLDQIAAGGRFNLPQHTPMESAQLANFYEAMIWYAQMKHMAIDYSSTT